ncbi:MAG: IS110 family transposase [Acidimicrobiales bacterium]|jgi:transposase
MQRRYVGIDLHRRRSVVVTMDEAGEVLSAVRIANDPVAMSIAVAEAGEGAEVAFEATYGWYWLADLLKADGHHLHLAHPLAMRGMTSHRRVKTDWKDATLLADVLRMGSFPEGWIAPPELRELRELVRYRAKLVALRSGLKAQVHAVMAKNGILPARVEMFGPGGQAQLDSLDVPMNFTIRIESLRDLVEIYDREVAMLEREIHRQLKDDRGYQAIQKIVGVGKVIGAIFVAEIGDISRFSSPERLCSWAGLTPKHRESDLTKFQGDITKQGNKLVRWAAIEAISGYRGGAKLRADYERIAERRGKYRPRAAVAHKLMVLIYYGLRDGEIRCLERAG